MLRCLQTALATPTLPTPSGPAAVPVQCVHPWACAYNCTVDIAHQARIGLVATSYSRDHKPTKVDLHEGHLHAQPYVIVHMPVCSISTHCIVQV